MSLSLHRSESKLRSLFKGLTWRITASIAIVVLVYLFTGSIELSMEIGIFDVIVKLTLYYFHERIWNVVTWGRKET